ncbi:MAG: DUF655 domain-containing protein [Cenarchaeum sp. SB0661_bin_35]|nr:DUF655 domain-containing protein [Cenarchaeum sp. SB0667_bin_13]MYC79672.1 DUF655 domain-containing protein [Cenarchaeum sp. SB0661_bin_35]MYI51398.1 DUF655 domain-containing protein [Cenarchaeum sp. SB0673_bin_9]
MRDKRHTLRETRAYILDVRHRSRSTIQKYQEGTILTAIGDMRFMLLEMIGKPGVKYTIGESVNIEDSISSVMGRLNYDDLSHVATDEVPLAIQKIVETCEDRFVQYINNAVLVTARFHPLSVMPGVGRATLKSILDRRDVKKFESYGDIATNTRWQNPAESIIQRISHEVMGQTSTYIFVRR